jgi:hypothetical protein
MSRTPAAELPWTLLLPSKWTRQNICRFTLFGSERTQNQARLQSPRGRPKTPTAKSEAQEQKNEFLIGDLETSTI